MKIIFDFDHTLFWTKGFYDALKRAFKKLGVNEKLFQESYQKSKEINKVFKPLRQFKLIIEQKPEIREKDLTKTFNRVLRNAPQFLYKDILSFLEKWQKKADLILLSYGEKMFQKQKIRASGIQKYFKEIIITKDVEKLKPFKKIFKNSEKTVFIEDNLQTLSKIKKIFGSVITVGMNRKKRRYSQISDNKNIDFLIKNLQELEKILKK